MNVLCNKAIYVIGAILFAFQLAPQSYTFEEIRSAAYKMNWDYRAARSDISKLGIYYGDDIPPAYWNEVIKNIRPIWVYNHRLNVVIALRVKDGVEEGLYVFNVESSYAPMRYGT